MSEALRAALLALLALALAALPLIANFPSHPRMLAVLNDAAHAPVFGAFAVVMLALLRCLSAFGPGKRYAAAFAFTILVGGAIELIQPMIGRGSQWSDLLNDTMGAIAGLAIAALFEFRTMSRAWRRWIGLILTGAAAFCLWPIAEASAAYALRAIRFPTLLQATTRFDRYFLDHRGVAISTQALPDEWRHEDDPPGLRVQIAGGRWPGISLTEPAADWSRHSRLMLDVTNPEPATLALKIRVHDRAHDNALADRFNEVLVLAPLERQVIVLPLAAIAHGPTDRALDLSRVAGLMLFCDGNSVPAGRIFYITRIWVE